MVRSSRLLPPTSPLEPFASFVDDAGLLCVDGRLKNYALDFDPIISLRGHIYKKNLNLGLRAVITKIRSPLGRERLFHEC